ncbi:P-loop containing nucleoside triphosphate hydrolase protein [Gorgonomyces haynaldii]|nr:P-loop containing nucleoside triphosphate hydrolase protein [Gorgonomyces haynaldii]
MSARDKYKIEKKVAESKRKARKEAKKNPSQRKQLKKDPGIPNMYPFKEKLLLQAEEHKRMMEEEKLARKQDPSLTKDQNDLAQLVRDAEKRSLSHTIQNDQEEYLGEAVVTGRKDNSKKAFYKEFKKVVEQADVILEVLDARDPLGCRTKEIEELILNAGAQKRIILVLNKVDLVPREVVEQWLKYLRNEFPTVAFKASTQSQRSNLGQSSVALDQASEGLLSGSESLGADNLIRILKNYCRSKNIKTSITVGIVGFPNVGKSSVINSLKRSKVCNVGSTPGVTKVSQLIQLDKNIKLIDSPGIVFSKSTNAEDSAQVLLRNCVKVEQLEDPVAPVELIVSRCDVEQLTQIYSIPYFSGTQEFLRLVARQRGKLKRGGIPDLNSAARSVIQDWNQGRIPFYTIPPKAGVAVESHVSSAIVSSWSKEFQLPDIGSDEIVQSIKPQSQLTAPLYAVKSSVPVPVDMDMKLLPEGYQQDESMEEDVPEAIPDEEEPMEEDTPVLPEIRFKQVSKKQRQVEKQEQIMTEEEQAINLQLNQMSKKQLKKSKKDQRRKTKKQDVDMTEDYDFAALQ